MKRFVFLVLSICMIFSASLSGFANSANYIDNSSRIEMVFSSEAERDAFVHSDQYDPSARYLFVIESSESVTTRAVCYFCGKNTMGIATMEEDYGAAGITCPYDPLCPDSMEKYRVFKAERCAACGNYVEINFIRWRYVVNCTITGGQFDVIPGATMEQGYDAHECLPGW